MLSFTPITSEKKYFWKWRWYTVIDEIEVATIALPLQSSLAMLVMQCQTRNLPKRVLHAQSFFLIFSFSFSHQCCGCTRLANSITTQNNPWYAMILSEKPTSWWKNAPCNQKSTGTNTEALYCWKRYIKKNDMEQSASHICSSTFAPQNFDLY